MLADGTPQRLSNFATESQKTLEPVMNKRKLHALAQVILNEYNEEKLPMDAVFEFPQKLVLER